MASEKLYYQWIKGDNAPNIETFNKEISLGEETYLLFESGAQVNKKLIGDFVMSIPDDKTPFINPEDYFMQNQKQTTVPYDQYTQPPVPINEKDENHMGNAEIIPHPDDLTGTRDFNMRRSQNKHKPVLDKTGQNEIIINSQQNQNTPNHQTLPGLQPVVKEINPIEQLIEKSKKYTTKVSINLDLDLPNISFLQILQESFEGNEEDIVKYVLALFKTPSFDKKLEEFVRDYLNIKEPEIIEQIKEVDETEGNVKPSLLKKESGEKIS